MPTKERDDQREEERQAWSAFYGDSRDYLWARLPFLVPMATKIARECCGSGPNCVRLAALVDQLHAVVLSHLDHEERTLAHLSSDGDGDRVTSCVAKLSAQHERVWGVLEEVCQAAGLPRRLDEDACPTVHVFYEELGRLDHYLRAQLAIEDRMLADRAGRTSVGEGH